MNARQQITAATYGSSLSASFGYDAYGYPDYTTVGSIMSYDYDFEEDDAWLNSRANNNHSGCNESFEYDNLERLDRVYRGGTTLLDMAYSTNGNITTKSDVGSVQFGYNNSSKPYALTDIEAVNGLISDTLQMVSSYTSFEQPSSITENPYQATLTYNSDDQRAKITVTQGGSTILTRWYAGNRYMKETAGSVTKEYTYIGGDAYTAPVVAVTQGGTTTYYYLLRDHLGSVTHLVNTSNTIVAEYSYDAWGRRRVDDDWDNYNVSSEPDLFAGRGFTGHEYLPWFNLYNMNGRLYDPIVSRCLSPDENVSFSDFTQSYNRYSYALNNPLSITDPDGENPLIILGAILGGWIGMGQAMINSDKEGWGLVGDMAKGLFVGAAAGATGAWAGGAVAGAIGTGGFLGGVASGVAGGFTGGFVGGVGSAWLNGADFGQGLSAGFNTGVTSGLIGGAVGGIVGGFSSMGQGGNFWDGNFRTGPLTSGMQGGGKIYGPFSLRQIDVYGTPRLGMGAVKNTSWFYNMPQHFIKAYQSNGWEKFRDNYGFVGRTGYNFIDQSWITTQRMILQKVPSQISHLNKAGLVSSDLLDASINTMTNFAPISKIAQSLNITKAPLNVAQFNNLYKGSGINSAMGGGSFIRQSNYVIRNNGNFQGTWNGIGFSSFIFGGY